MVPTNLECIITIFSSQLNFDKLLSLSMIIYGFSQRHLNLRLFPKSRNPQFQNKSKCKTFRVTASFIRMKIKNYLKCHFPTHRSLTSL